jgi:hypothetical protein
LANVSIVLKNQGDRQDFSKKKCSISIDGPRRL